MPRKIEHTPSKTQRRQYTDEFKREAVQMLLDGHAAASIAERLGIPDVHMLYRWRAALTREAGAVGEMLDARVKALEAELRRVERERDVLKQALTIFGRGESG